MIEGDNKRFKACKIGKKVHITITWQVLSLQDIMLFNLLVKKLPMLDAHIHLCDEQLFPQVELLIQEALAAYVEQFLCVVTNSLELTRALALKKKFPCIKIAAATTPHEATVILDPFFEELNRCAEEGLIDAIGETGLEYFHPGLDRGVQKEYLHAYIPLALKHNLPLIFHCREAFKDLYDILKGYRGQVRGMIHCFTGSYQEALEMMELGLYLSISGIVTYKNSTALQTTVRKIPLDSLLIETDSPYLAPLSHRGKTNRPLYIKETYEKVAYLKGVSVQELERHVAANYFKIF